jgi:hypothetical protein
VGRGYQKLDGSDVRWISIFDPWNEADWLHNGNTTWGTHLVTVGNMTQSTKANPNENIGL